MWGAQRSQLLRVIIFLGPQCPCVWESKTKRNPSPCPSSSLYRIPLSLPVPRGLLGSSGVFLSVARLSNSFLLPLIFSGLYQSDIPLPFSALLSPAFYMLAVKDVSSPWTAMSMWHVDRSDWSVDRGLRIARGYCIQTTGWYDNWAASSKQHNSEETWNESKWSAFASQEINLDSGCDRNLMGLLQKETRTSTDSR
jgi:hypothetical protein